MINKLSLFLITICTVCSIKVYSQDSLRIYMDMIPGKYLGTALANNDGESFWSTFYNLPTRNYPKKVLANFNSVVCGNEMKMGSIFASMDVFNFAYGDNMCTFGQEHDILTRGHTLIWHSQMPGWLGGGSDGTLNLNGYTRDSLLKIMEHYITTVVTHYKGRVKEWDVVNEPFDGEGNLRPSIWKDVIGDDYIDSAFIYAHRADPDALLVLNEYANQTFGSKKADGMFNKVKELVEKGIPVHAAGFQCHQSIRGTYFPNVEKNFKRYHDINVKCIVTELDIKIPASQMGTEDALKAQADDYVNFMKLMIETDYCHEIVVWGFTDKYSWIPAHTNNAYGQACLFDEKVNPKPAYYAVKNYLRSYLGLNTNIEQNTANSKPFNLTVKNNELIINMVDKSEIFSNIAIYNITGRRINIIDGKNIIENNIPINYLNNGLYLLVLTDANNRTYTQKFIKH